MIAFTKILSDSGLIEFLYSIQENEDGNIEYNSLSILFKNVAGEEIDYWDNESFIWKIFKFVEASDRISLEKELASDISIPMSIDFFLENREEWIQLVSFSQKLIRKI